MHKPLLAGLAAASIGVASALVALTTPAAAAAPARPVLYVSSQYDTNLSVYDATTNEFLTRVDLGYQQYSSDVETSPDGSRAYVTTPDSVAIVDTATSTVVHHVLVNTPTATALTPDGSRVFAVSQTGAVKVFPTANPGDVTVINAGQGAFGIAFTPDGKRAYVPNNVGVAVIDTTTDTVLTTISLAAPGRPIASPDGKRLLVTTGGTYAAIIDTATNTVTKTIEFPYVVQDYAFTPDGHLYVVSRNSGVVLVVDPATFTVLATVNIEGGANAVAVAPGGDRVLATGWNPDVVSVIDTATNAVTGSFTAPSGPGGLAFATLHPAAPTASLELSIQPQADYVNYSADGSTHGFATPLHYRIDFGDGTPAVDAPVGFHRYAHSGTYSVTLTVTDDLGGSGTATRQITITALTRTIALLSRDGLRYVSAENGGAAPLVANRAEPGAWELFNQVNLSSGDVGLQAQVNGKYLTADAAGRLTANGTEAGAARFRLVTGADGVFALQSVTTGKYVSTNNGNGPITADRAAIGAWEQFYAAVATNVSFRARANDRYVTAEAGGAKPLIANRTTVGQWERFDEVDAGDGSLALFSRANNRFVTAEAGGAQPLIANRTAIGAWEKFLPTVVPGNYWLLQAKVNNRFVTAEAGGAQPLIANRAATGTWEQFTPSTP